MAFETILSYLLSRMQHSEVKDLCEGPLVPAIVLKNLFLTCRGISVLEGTLEK
jgi:hypothetical protein